MSRSAVGQGRQVLWDVLKIILMYFVIQGHLVGQGIVMRPDEVDYANCVVGNIVVGVSMPMFFMISGMFAYKAILQDNIDKPIGRIILFAWPVIAFGILFGVYGYARGGLDIMSTLKFPITLLRRLWFVRTLVVVYALVLVVARITRSWRNLIIGLLVVYICLIVNPSCLGLWFLREVMHMFPYFVFGLLVLSKWNLYDRAIVGLICGAVFLPIVFLEGDHHVNGMGFYYVSAYWKDMLLSSQGLIAFFGRTIVGITGSLFIMFLIKKVLLLVSHLKFNIPTGGGRTTLGVYVMHEWVLGCLGAHWPFPVANGFKWILAAGFFVFFHQIVVTIQSCCYTNIIFFGDEKWLRRAVQKVIDK